MPAPCGSARGIDLTTWHLTDPTAAGRISLCPHQGCAFRCCDAQQTGEIFLYPGEVEEAAAQGRSLRHLEILDADYHGGTRVRCRATDMATCDGGHKPLDCVSYPFFPKPSALDSSGRPGVPLLLTKGAACPIETSKIPGHEAQVRELWAQLIARRPSVLSWLRVVWDDDAVPDVVERYELP